MGHKDDDVLSHYHYASSDGLRSAGPTFWISVMFVVLFSLSTSLHLVQLTWKRVWFLLPTIFLAGLGETIGWAGRTWSSKNPALRTPYLMQITTTIISPTFFSAANFIILGRVVNECKGERFSRLSPRNYTRIFLTIDFCALFVQAAGGGIASGDGTNNAKVGGHIMLAGILIQFVAICIYSLLAGDFIRRLHTNKPIASRMILKGASMSDVEMAEASRGSDDAGRPLKPTRFQPDPSTRGGVTPVEYGGSEFGVPKHLRLMLLGLAFSTFLLFIRAIYRTAELSDGWTGHIIRTEVYFNIFDGGMIVLAMWTLNVFHPGWLLSQYRH